MYVFVRYMYIHNRIGNLAKILELQLGYLHRAIVELEFQGLGDEGIRLEKLYYECRPQNVSAPPLPFQGVVVG